MLVLSRSKRMANSALSNQSIDVVLESKSDIKHSLSGVFFMLLGFLAIFVLLVYLNEAVDIEKDDKSSSMTEFQVKKINKHKPKKEVKKKVQKRSDLPPPPIPAASLGLELSGIDLGALGYASGQVGVVDEALLGDTKNVVMTSDMVDVAPKPALRAPLEFPARAKNREIEGYVVLNILINESGKVEKVSVLEGFPANTFEKAAVRSIRNWIFEPARYQGKPVKTWANQTIRFELN